MKESYKFFSYLRGVIDIVVFNGSFFIAYYLKFDQLPNFSKPNQYAMLHVVSNLIYFTSAILAGIYNFEIPLSPPETKTRKVLKAYISFVFVYLLFIVATRGYHYSRIFHFYFISIGFFLLVLAELFSSLILFPYLSKRKRFKKRVILLGAGVLGQIAYEKLKNMPGYEIVGFLDDDSEKASFLNGKYLGKVSDLENLLSLRKVEVDEILVTLPLDNDELIKNVVETAERNCISVKIIPSYHKLFLSRTINIGQVDGIPVLNFGREKLSYLHNRVIKRLFDIVFSSLVLLTIFPFLFLFASIGIKLSSPGPIFFKQKRKGYRGKPFVCYKFRTMHVTPQEIADKLQATPDDPRKFKFGHFLRKTNLDEFPQFLNVLKGEMSVVGPRPHPLYLDEKYQDIVKEYNVRFFAKPGVTGWAQVNGYRGETRDVEAMRKRVEHDIWYIENWSFGLDIKIILMTIFKMIKGDPNAY
jgi:putative colanic acid biosysnthesis UDP-glucose lipid carrier transferase